MNEARLTQEIDEKLRSGKKLRIRDFIKIYSISENPLSLIILKKYKNGDDLDTRKMIKDLTGFIISENIEEKMKFLFSLYDYNNDGYVSKYDLFVMLKSICDKKHTDVHIQQIVDRTFVDLKTESVNYATFKDCLKKKNKNLNTFMRC